MAKSQEIRLSRAPPYGLLSIFLIREILEPKASSIVPDYVNRQLQPGRAALSRTLRKATRDSYLPGKRTRRNWTTKKDYLTEKKEGDLPRSSQPTTAAPKSTTISEAAKARGAETEEGLDGK